MELRLSPRIEPTEQAPAHQESAREAPTGRESADTSLDTTLPARLALAASALDRVERKQVERLAQLRAPMVAAAERLRIALAETGLSSDRLIPPSGANKEAPRGGPLVPVQFGPDSSPFGREFARMREAVLATDRLRRIVPSPVAQAALRRP